MERRSANRSLLRAGFVLILLGVLTGLTGPLLAGGGARLAACLAGVLSGMFLVLLGLSWRHLNLSVPVGRILEGLARLAGYGTWGAALLAGLWSVGGPTPLASPPARWQELTVVVVAVAVAVVGISTLGLVVNAMRPRPRPPGVV